MKSVQLKDANISKKIHKETPATNTNQQAKNTRMKYELLYARTWSLWKSHRSSVIYFCERKSKLLIYFH